MGVGQSAVKTLAADVNIPGYGPASLTPLSVRPTRGRQAVIALAAAGLVGQQMQAPLPGQSRSGLISMRQVSVSVLQSEFC